MLIKNFKYLIGILHGSKAFIGPYNLQINPTNECNNKCIYCGHHSPLIKKPKPKEFTEQKLSFEKIKEIIDDAKMMGTENILLSGGGEPFLHHKIYEIIEYIKEKGLKCILMTNGTYIGKKGAKRLFDLRIDKVWLNLSSGNAKSYMKLYVNQTEETFYKIQDWLLYLKKLKRNKKSRLPFISLVSVISKKNYKELSEIFDFGEKVGADEISLTPTCLTRWTTSLSLTKEQRDIVCNDLLTIKKKAMINHNIDSFLKQVMHKAYLKGRTDRELPEKMPCYIGWIFAGIHANGDVVTCCGSPHQIMGNIYVKKFRDVWYSKEYSLFRMKSKRVIKDKTLKCACMPDEEIRLNPDCILFPYNLYVHKNLRLFDYKKILKEEAQGEQC